MCRSTVEKEEVFVSQNAAGGNNDATLKEIGGHVDRLSIVTYIVLVIIGVIAVYVGLRRYRSCNRLWIQQEIGMSTMQRIRSSIKGRTEVMDGVEPTTKCLIDSVEMYAGMLDGPDGLRSSKLSTITSARGFSSLKDAIQAAKDEACTSFQLSGVHVQSKWKTLRDGFTRY